MISGNAGGEGNGKADIETFIPGPVCSVDYWTLHPDGFSGDCEFMERDWLLTFIGNCDWFQVKIVGDFAGGIALFAGAATSTLGMSLSVEGDEVLSATWTRPTSEVLYGCDEETDFYLTDVETNLCPDLPAVITVTARCFNAVMTGRAGGEGDGKAVMSINEMTGNAGVEIDGKATIETS